MLLSKFVPSALSVHQDLRVRYFIRTIEFLKDPKLFYYALISTSTPEGRSNLLNASTVRLEEV